MEKKKAFTLIELLVVISIIALLMSILVPALSKVKQLARLTVCKSNLKNLGTSTFAYASSNREKLPIGYWRSGPEGTTSTWQSYVMKELDEYMSRPNSKNFGTEIFGFGYLWRDNLLDEPKIFVCPGATRQDVDMESYTRRIYDFNEDHIKRFDSIYSYLPLTKTPSRSGGQIDFWQSAKKASELTGFAPLCMDKLRSVNDFLHTKGNREGAQPLINVCFGDGHIVTVNNREFFTKDKITELKALPGYGVIPTRDLFDFLDTIEN